MGTASLRVLKYRHKTILNPPQSTSRFSNYVIDNAGTLSSITSEKEFELKTINVKDR